MKLYISKSLLIFGLVAVSIGLISACFSDKGEHIEECKPTVFYKSSSGATIYKSTANGNLIYWAEDMHGNIISISK